MWDYPRVMLIKRWLYYQGDHKLGFDHIVWCCSKDKDSCSKDRTDSLKML